AQELLPPRGRRRLIRNSAVCGLDDQDRIPLVGPPLNDVGVGIAPILDAVCSADRVADPMSPDIRLTVRKARWGLPPGLSCGCNGGHGGHSRCRDDGTKNSACHRALLLTTGSAPVGWIRMQRLVE